MKKGIDLLSFTDGDEHEIIYYEHSEWMYGQKNAPPYECYKRTYICVSIDNRRIFCIAPGPKSTNQ